MLSPARRPAAARASAVAPVVVALIVQRVQAVAAVKLLIDLEVKVWVAVLLVDAQAFFDNLGDLTSTLLRSSLVRLFCCLGGRLGLGGGALGSTLGEFVLWDDGGC